MGFIIRGFIWDIPILIFVGRRKGPGFPNTTHLPFVCWGLLIQPEYGFMGVFRPFFSVLAFMFFGLEGKSSDVFNFSGKLTVYFWGLNRQNSVLG